MAELLEPDYIEEREYEEPAVIEVAKTKKPHELIAQLEDGNLVSKLEDHDDLTAADVYDDIMQTYGDAQATMTKWLKKYTAALKLAKMQPSAGGQDVESKSFPFAGASLAMMPFILQAMLDFASRASPDLVWTDKLVSGQVCGMDRDETKLARAVRAETYQNYQLINDIPGWRKGQDKNVFTLPCVGTAYKKTYFDFEEQVVCSDFRMADKVIFNFDYDTFEDAPDKFEPLKLTRNQVIGYIRGEQQWDIAEDELEEDKDTFEFIEAHTWIDLDGDGLKEPYCAILFEELNRVVSLYPDYDEDTVTFNDKGKVVKIRDKEVYTQYIFLPDPEGGPMGLGWGILLGPTFTAINTLVRDNLDAGTLALTASNTGLIAQSVGEGRGNRQLSARLDLTLGTLTPWPMGGLQGSLKDNVVQLPYAGASAVLFDLTKYLADTAQQMTTAAYQVEANQGEAASLYLARLQQGLKTPNMIVMRVYECMKKEMQKIALLNFKHYDNAYYNEILDEAEQANMANDFNPKDYDVKLVADPSQGSDIERVGKADQVYGMCIEQAGLGQNVINLRAASINKMKALGIKDEDIQTLAPEPDPNAPPSKEVQLMLAQQAFEADLKKKALDLEQEGLEIKKQEMQQRAEKVRLDGLKQARDAALELSKLGLQADLDEAAITEKYANALKGLVKDAGLSVDQAKSMIGRIESDFIGKDQNQKVRRFKYDPTTDALTAVEDGN
jgi:chaperonin GroES